MSARPLLHACIRSKAVSVFSISLMPLWFWSVVLYLCVREATEAAGTFTAHSISASIFLSLSADSSSVFAFKHGQRNQSMRHSAFRSKLAFKHMIREGKVTKSTELGLISEELLNHMLHRNITLYNRQKSLDIQWLWLQFHLLITVFITTKITPFWMCSFNYINHK